MKYMILTAIICTSLLLSACASEKSIGIIGGTDGPTKVYVSTTEEASEKRPLRIIRVDGALYYDTRKDSPLTPRCGTMDGQLTQTANDYEVPQQDGECNFSGAQGYQIATEMTKEVPLDSGWRIFRKIYEPQKDIPAYQYCYLLKGTLPNAAAPSEFLVLANERDWDFAAVANHFLSADSKDHRDLYAIPLPQEDKWGITLRAQPVGNTGLTLCFEQAGGSPSGELQTGAWYTIEKNNNGAWEPVAPKIPEPEIAWEAVAYPIAKNDKTSLSVDWGWLYGELPSGEYRIGKWIDDFEEAGVYDSDLYYAEFTLN